MARRFIDTGFFKDPFVRGLQGAYKGLYIYLFLDCSNAGLWNVELDVAKLRCGIDQNVSDEEIKEVFSDKIVEVDNGAKWFLKNYLKVQHNGLLKRNNKAHISAIEELLKYDLIEEFKEGEFQLSEKIIKGLPRGLQDPKVMVKVKVKDKVEVKGNGKGKNLENSKNENFLLYDLDVLKKEIRNEFSWKESLVRDYKEILPGFKMSDLENRLEIFFKILRADGEVEKTLKDFKKHFNRWTMIQLKNQFNGNRNSNRTKSDSELKQSASEAVDRLFGS